MFARSPRDTLWFWSAAYVKQFMCNAVHKHSFGPPSPIFRQLRCGPTSLQHTVPLLGVTSTVQRLTVVDLAPAAALPRAPLPVLCKFLCTAYLFLRWVYARAGVTAKVSGTSLAQQQYQPVPQFTKQGALAVVSDCGDTANGSDSYLIESHLEMSDYPRHQYNSGSGSSSGGGSRDSRPRGSHAL
jgi:hypothetical protein